MANITITIPDEKLPLIKAFVDFKDPRGIAEGWTNAQYSQWIKDYIESKLRADVKKFQQIQYEQGFLFDDPIA